MTTLKTMKGEITVAMIIFGIIEVIILLKLLL